MIPKNSSKLKSRPTLSKSSNIIIYFSTALHFSSRKVASLGAPAKASLTPTRPNIAFTIAVVPLYAFSKVLFLKFSLNKSE